MLLAKLLEVKESGFVKIVRVFKATSPPSSPLQKCKNKGEMRESQATYQKAQFLKTLASRKKFLMDFSAQS